VFAEAQETPRRRFSWVGWFGLGCIVQRGPAAPAGIVGTIRNAMSPAPTSPQILLGFADRTMADPF
jgi:hypothetical protein